MLYLDDRTILGRSVADIRIVQSAWNQLSDVSRLRTHPDKAQLWGRTEEAKRHLQSSNEADVKRLWGSPWRGGWLGDESPERRTWQGNDPPESSSNHDFAYFPENEAAAC